MKNSVKAFITKEYINIQEGYDFIKDDGFGAFNTFVGVVRNIHEGNDVLGIEYDAQETLATNVLLQICNEANEKWRDTKVYAVHYKGKLEIGGISIFIAVGSKHRDESFKACRYVIEEVKKRLPVWKQEHYKSGKTSWLKGHSLR